MKKNIAMRVASLVLMCTIVTSCFVSSTFAKYTSSAKGSDSVTVAKWAVSAGGTDITQADTVSFDLFGTVLDSDYTTTEQNVATGTDGKTLVAPGTSGKFVMTVANNSEVDAEYSLTLTETNANSVPIQYSADGNDWEDELSAINIIDKGLNRNTNENITVYWRWVFDAEETSGAHDGQTNKTDTNLGAYGTNSAPTVSITADIVIEQVD